MRSVYLVSLIFLFLIPAVCGLGVSFPMWIIRDNDSVVSSRMTVLVTNPAVYGWYDRIVVTDDSDSGLLSFDGHVLNSSGSIVGYVGDLVDNAITFPVYLNVNWTVPESRSFPMSVYIVYNTTEGFMVSTGVGGTASAVDLRGSVPEDFAFLAIILLSLLVFSYSAGWL